MSLVVEFVDDGVLVKQPEKGRSIILNTIAWTKLIQLKKEVEEAIAKREEKKWCLQNPDLFVHTCIFRDNFYIHIRKWSNERPTSRGVALHPDQWKKKLCDYLIMSDEMKLVKEVHQCHIQEKLKKLIAERCEGCTNSWSSQNDHECLMNAHELAKAHIDEAAKPLTYQKFLVKLAQLGQARNVSVRYPWISNAAVLNLYIKDIKQEVVDSYNF